MLVKTRVISPALHSRLGFPQHMVVRRLQVCASYPVVRPPSPEPIFPSCFHTFHHPAQSLGPG